MQLVKISGEHTIDVDLLPQKPVVLDVGCRRFDFAQEILTIRPEAEIYSLDPDRIIEDPHLTGCRFIRAALVGDERREAEYVATLWENGNANTLKPHYPFTLEGTESYMVPCVRVTEIGPRYWDVVKLDCEGSEFEILEDWPGAIATQISVEFHDWNKLGEKGEAYYAKLWSKLSEYVVVQHEFSETGGSMGHWDTLLVRRQYLEVKG